MKQKWQLCVEFGVKKIPVWIELRCVRPAGVVVDNGQSLDLKSSSLSKSEVHKMRISILESLVNKSSILNWAEVCETSRITATLFHSMTVPCSQGAALQHIIAPNNKVYNVKITQNPTTPSDWDVSFEDPNNTRHLHKSSGQHFFKE